MTSQIKLENKFGIIILNWNSSKNTIECINSILLNDYSNYHIYLIDNGSKKSDYLFLKKNIKNKKNITLIRNIKNLGFAQGCNIGIKKALQDGIKHFLLLNNDTIVEKNFFSKLNRYINDIKEYGIISPTIYNYYTKKIWRKGDWLTFKKTSGIRKIKRPVGCAYLINKETIEKVGFFDSNFFAYGEEEDYSYRCRKKGLNIYYVSDCNVWHKVVEFRNAPYKIYLNSRNNWYLYNKYQYPEKIFYYIYLIFLKLPIKFLKYFYKRRAFRAFYDGNRDGLRWIITKMKPQNHYIKE